MKNLERYLGEKFYHVLVFVIIAGLGSSFVVYGILDLFKVPEKIYDPFFIFSVIFLGVSFFLLLFRVDFKNFSKLKLLENSPEGILEKLNQEISQKSEEVQDATLDIRYFSGRLTDLKHEKIKLEEKRAEIFKNHPELRGVS